MLKLGIALRVMGPASQPDTLLACARAAESAGLHDLFVPDHIAIPPDDSEGSDGRYLDPLATLAHLAAATERIGLGTGVLILPYRSPLPTAKWLATIQELSGGRLRLGVGIGWMKPEFRVLGVDRRRRAAISDATLRFLHECFEAEDDVVVANGQPFLFRPRPARPPIFVGGAPPHALERAARLGDGWMPMGGDPQQLRAPIERLRALAESAGRATPEVVVLGGLAGEPEVAAGRLRELASIGVTRFVHGSRYARTEEFQRSLDALVRVREILSRG